MKSRKPQTSDNFGQEREQYVPRIQQLKPRYSPNPVLQSEWEDDTHNREDTPL